MVWLVAAGCGDDDGATDDPTIDGGPRGDAGPGVDAGPAADGGPRRDAGPGLDAGPPDDSCAFPAPFDVGASYERILHVAADAGPGGDGSEGSPFDSIRAAVSAATPGTEVRIAAGTYSSLRLDAVTGELERPIAIVADGDVQIDGGGTDTGLAMSDAQFVVVQGLTIVNAGVHGMNLDDGGSYDTPAHHLVLRDITVIDAGSGGNNDCIKMSGVDDFWIDGATVSGCDRGEGIDMVGCHRGLIQRVIVRDVVGSGIQAKGGSADVTIHAGRFTNVPGRGVNAGGSTGLEFFRPLDAPHEAANIRVLANLFEDVGAESGAPVAFVGCDGCVVANNTIIRPQTWVARILQESTDARFVPSRDGLFVNNLIVLNTADIRTFVNVGANTAPETFIFGSNLWWALDEGAGWGGPTYSGGLPAETDSVIQEDPQLTGADQVPAGSSPAAGAGRVLSFAPIPDRLFRCYEDPPSIGAYEVAE